MYSIDNTQIGKHLGQLIKQKGYKSDRVFCIEYLKLRDGKENPDDIPKMQNRICQIKQGNKGIQIEDLPLFSELLEVSIEDILSAGKALAPVSNRKTNYSITFSKNPKEWDEYIRREDKLILNPDEYNKTVIDYALDAGNFAFLKYLMDKKYIWFVSDNPQEYYIGFGAGTNIERRPTEFLDSLNYKLKENDDLRFKMIALAIKNKQFEMLDELHARELPLLYQINPFQIRTSQGLKLPSSNNIDQMIDAIATGGKEVINYFFEEFEIQNTVNNTTNTFIFPYAGRIIDALIRNKMYDESKVFLQKALDYNNKVSAKLNSLVNSSIEKGKAFYTDSKNSYYKKSDYKRLAWKEYYFLPDVGFLGYYMPMYLKNVTGFVTNVINVTQTSKSSDLTELIIKLRTTYDQFESLLHYKED